MQDTLQEADTLTQTDEADHHGNDHGQQSGNFGQNALHHFSSDDGGQAGSTGSQESSHGITSLQKKILKNLYPK